MGKCFSICIPSKRREKRTLKGSYIEPLLPNNDDSAKKQEPLDLEKTYVQVLQEFRVTSGRIINTYNNEIPAALKTSGNKNKTQRILKEMQQMSKQLPISYTNSIFLRYDESSIDKMQALIIGIEKNNQKPPLKKSKKIK